MIERAPRPSNTLTAHEVKPIDHISEVFNQLQKLNIRIHDLTYRLVGYGSPAEESESKDRPTGTLPVLIERANDALGDISDINKALDNFEKII